MDGKANGDTQFSWFQLHQLLFKKQKISLYNFSDIQARRQRPVHEPQDWAGGGAVWFPVYAETLRWKTNRREVPGWQSHRTRY